MNRIATIVKGYPRLSETFIAQEILGLFRSIVRQEGITMLMTSHDALVDEYVDEMLLLKDGQIML